MERIERAITEIEAELRSLDADRLDRAQARRLLRLFARGERLCAGATAVLARRVGDPQIVARESGTSVGKARAIVGLSQRLGDTPVLRAAVCGGEVSLDQATEIAKAETSAPGSAELLVEVATAEPFHVLRERARAAVLDDRRDQKQGRPVPREALSGYRRCLDLLNCGVSHGRHSCQVRSALVLDGRHQVRLTGPPSIVMMSHDSRPLSDPRA